MMKLKRISVTFAQVAFVLGSVVSQTTFAELPTGLAQDLYGSGLSTLGAYKGGTSSTSKSLTQDEVIAKLEEQLNDAKGKQDREAIKGLNKELKSIREATNGMAKFQSDLANAQVGKLKQNIDAVDASLSRPVGALAPQLQTALNPEGIAESCQLQQGIAGEANKMDGAISELRGNLTDTLTKLEKGQEQVAKNATLEFQSILAKHNELLKTEKENWDARKAIDALKAGKTLDKLPEAQQFTVAKIKKELEENKEQAINKMLTDLAKLPEVALKFRNDSRAFAKFGRQFADKTIGQFSQVVMMTGQSMQKVAKACEKNKSELIQQTFALQKGLDDAGKGARLSAQQRQQMSKAMNEVSCKTNGINELMVLNATLARDMDNVTKAKTPTEMMTKAFDAITTAASSYAAVMSGVEVQRQCTNAREYLDAVRNNASFQEVLNGGGGAGDGQQVASQGRPRNSGGNRRQSAQQQQNAPAHF